MKTIAFLAAVALTCAAGFSQDVIAPSVTSASISQTPVNVTNAVQTINVTLHITDNDSGFQYGNLFLYTPAGNFVDSVYFNATQRTGGGNLDGTYVIPIEVPRYGPPGTWRVDALVEDQTGNRRNLGGPDPNNTPFLPTDTMTFPVINSGQVDSTAPVLVSPSVTPAAVDVTISNGSVTFTFGATDALSGVDYGFIYPHAPGGGVNYSLLKYFTDSERISGTAGNGTYQVTFVLPQGSEAGTWTFEIFLQDKVGNNSFGSAGSVAVNSAPPTQFVKFLAQAVDAVQLPFTTSGAGWVMQNSDSNDGIDSAMSLPVEDDGDATFRTTVAGPGMLSFKWRVDSQAGSDYLSVSVDGISNGEISGSTGWETKTLTLLGGNHTVEWTYRKDGGGSNGDDRGWVDEVRFQAGTDAALPQLQDLRFSSRSLDLTQGMQEVTVTVDATDDARGLSGVLVELFDPSGNGQTSSSINGLSDLAGSYVFVFQIPSNSEFGLWRAQVTLTEDTSGNEVIYGTGGETFPVREIEKFTPEILPSPTRRTLCSAASRSLRESSMSPRGPSWRPSPSKSPTRFPVSGTALFRC